MERMVAKSMKRFKIYFKIWLTTSRLSLESVFENRLGVILFTLGKIIRFTFFIFFLFIIHRQVAVVSGYTLPQMISFFLIFNILDLFGQLFFRGIYFFREQIISGEFDFKLIKPISPLFQSLTRHTDILDLPLLLIALGYLLTQIGTISFIQMLAFALTLANGLIIITAIHIAVAALGIITTEIDHTIMIYRDISQMARVPIDLYTDSVRSVLTFVIPVAIAYTLPAKSLMGLASGLLIVQSVVIALLSLVASLWLWNFALTKYSSASS